MLELIHLQLLTMICQKSHKETQVHKLVYKFDETGFEQFLLEKDYGHINIEEIAIILMCRSPHINFKQRIRLDKVSKVLYIDLMLDYHKMVNSTDDERLYYIVEKFVNEVPVIIRKYVKNKKAPDFDVDRFEKDIIEFFKSKNLLK